MNWLETLLPPALVRALGWTLVHSLWQGAVVALALAGLLLLLRQHQATVRYRTAGAALLVLLTLAGITFARYYTAAPPTVASATAGYSVADAATVPATGTPAVTPAAAGTVPAATPVAVAPAAPTGLQAWIVYFDNNLPVLVAAWLLGLLAMTLRLLGGLAYVQRLRRYRVQPLAEEWQQRLQMLAAKARLTQPVQLLESALVRAPVVVGHVAPVILLPLGTVSGLSAAYLEAILAHELAHVQRRDYLMNLLQSVAETLFFYHPAVWFITACLRTERENCCDDDATALVGGNPLTVARALAALAELTAAPEPANGRLALSALGPDGSVLGRIRRLVQGRTAPTFTEGFMAACVVLGGLVLLTSAVALADPRPARPDGGDSALARLPFLASSEADTTRKKSSLAPDAPATLPPVAGEDDLAALSAPAPADAATLPADAVEAASAADAADDFALADDEGKKRKRTRQQVVVVPGPGRGRPGTVVIEKDKKGRLTSLSVDGQPVATAGNAKGKSRKAASQVEVIQLPGGGRGWANGQNFNFRFDDNLARSFRYSAPGLTSADVARIKADAQRAAADARRQLRENPQWRAEASRSADGWADQALKGRLRDLESQLQALKGAERAVRATLQNDKLSEEQRENIQDQLDDVRDQMDTVRDELEDAQNDAEARQDEQEARRDEQEARREELAARRHEEQMRRHEQDMRRHEEDMRRHEQERTEEAALLRELRKDGLITSPNNVQLNLSAAGFTVNGKKQPAAVRDKYLKLVAQQTGRPFKGTYNFNRQSSSTTATFRGPSVPPAPPAPPAPGVPAPPTPPRPPRAPRFNSDNIRAELRKDGIIGVTEKSFQFQLNDDGLVVNGKKQPAALAEKYRRLVDATDANGRSVHRNIQVSVSE